MKKHFVTFESPGTFFSEETELPIESWNIQTAVTMARGITERHGARPFALYFTTRSRSPEDLDSKVTNTSGRFFLGGRIMTLAEVKKEMPEKDILIGNMECNNIDRVVVNKNSWTSIQPLGPSDVVLDVKL